MRAQLQQPLLDQLDLVEPRHGMSVVDLGAGEGTRLMQARLVDERPCFYPFERLLLWAAR